MYIMFFNTILFIALGVLMVLAAHGIANRRMGKKHPELLEMPDKVWGSSAFIIRRAGLYVSVLLGTFAVSQNIGDAAFAKDSIIDALTPMLLLESGLGLVSALVFVFTALRSVDKFILSNVDNDNAVVNNNAAVGITECAIFVATGFVSYGALLGEGHITSAWVFFLIGQAVFIVLGYLMEHVIHPSHNAKSDIEKGCIPSALIISSMLLVVAMFVKNGIAGDFYGYSQDIPYFLKMLGIQFGLFVGYLFLIEPILLAGMKLKPTALNGAVVRFAMQLMIAASIVYNVSL